MNTIDTLLIDYEQRLTAAHRLYMSLTEDINKALCEIESLATERLLIFDENQNLIESKTIHSKEMQKIIDRLLKYRQDHLKYAFRQYFNEEEIGRVFSVKENSVQATESHAPNSETLKVFEDTDAGKNLTEHKNIDEMHESIKELE